MVSFDTQNRFSMNLVGNTGTVSLRPVVGAGPPGPPGGPGPAGTVLNSDKGAWSAVTAYAIGDLVQSAGSTWQALTTSTNVTPVAGANWKVFAAKGTDGTGTVNSVNSVSPTSGNVVLTKSNIGLGSVDNTSDASKPISTATATALSAKADLVGGLVPTSQIPGVALTTGQAVASRAAMLALSNVQEGDIVSITATADKGTYLLGSGPSGTFSSWLMLSTPTDVVSSVNGQTGVVVLAASDVGAIATGGNAGTATKLATARNIDGVSFDGSADVTVLPVATHAATSKATPVDADELPLSDSAASFGLKKLTWANVKATLAGVFMTNTNGSGELVAALSATTGTATGDCATASAFTITPTGNFTVAFSNIPADTRLRTYQVEVTLGGTLRTMTAPANTTWPVGGQPVLVINKWAVFQFQTRDGGTNWKATGMIQA